MRALTLLRPHRKYRVDLSLPDDGKAAAPESRVHQQIVNVTQATGSAVDQEFAFAGSVCSPGDRNFGILKRQGEVAVIERNADFRHAKGLAAIRSRENDILQGGASQRANVLLAQYPTDGIGDVALSAAVRSDDGRNAPGKDQLHPLGKRT